MTTPLQNIKYVFVLMLENRSLDHMLGFSGITGTDAAQPTNKTKINGLVGNESNGGFEVSQPAGWVMPVDPCHEFPCVVEQLCGHGKKYPPAGAYPPIDSSGFVANYAENGGAPNPGQIMQCYSPSQLPVLNALAQEFVICDNWYSSMPGPTWPNRFFVHAASSAGLDHSPTGKDISKWFAEGLRFQKGTIFDKLRASSHRWQIFRGDLFPQVLSIFDLFHYFEDTKPLSQFHAAVQDDKYPYAYTFIEPNYGDVLNNTYKGGTCQHPIEDVTCGEWLIKYVYESLRSSPLWGHSLLLVTYDEHGGFYDHVRPGAAVAPGDNSATSSLNQSRFTFEQYGVRVPAVVVSPLIAHNLIDHRTYDHSSVLATVEALWGLGALTNRDAKANNLGSLVTLASARSTPATLPAPANSGGRCPFPAPFGVEAPFLPKARLVERPAQSLDEGNLPGFLYVAHRVDLAVSGSVSTLAQREDMKVQFQSLRTRADAAQYMEKVQQKVRLAEAIAK
jgi:phospholipase C